MLFRTVNLEISPGPAADDKDGQQGNQHPGPAAFPHAALAALPAASRILLAIGPEGGWVPTEREWLAAHGFATVSWGPRPLRTDTACAVLLGLLHAALAASHPAAAVPLDSPQA